MAEEFRRDPVATERRGGNGGLIIALLVIVGLAVLAFATGFIKMGGGEAPKIAIDGGQLPDVETGKVVVGTKKQTVDVPVIGTEPADKPSN